MESRYNLHHYGVTFKNDKNNLYHYGVKGMKWNKRKSLINKVYPAYKSDQTNDGYVVRRPANYVKKKNSVKIKKQAARNVLTRFLRSLKNKKK